MSLSFDHLLVEVDVRDLPGDVGRGLFVTEPVPAGAIVALFGGRMVPLAEFRELSEHHQRHSVQVADEVYLAGHPVERTVADYINHSCDPTLWLVGEVTLAARRDLVAGDQLTYDYATSDSTPYDEFECECGSPACRGKVTGEDWLDPVLRRRYAGHFSPYLERRIARHGD